MAYAALETVHNHSQWLVTSWCYNDMLGAPSQVGLYMEGLGERLAEPYPDKPGQWQLLREWLCTKLGQNSNIRMKSVLEHELTWAYYRMRRHAFHPLRKEVGDAGSKPLGEEDMRFGTGIKFDFWRDLKPPFFVTKVIRVDERRTFGHADGQLHKVLYSCGIDYASERMSGDVGRSTFDEKIFGMAQVRIPDDFPRKRPLTIVTWGKPSLKEMPTEDSETPEFVPPEQWMPIASELGLRAQDPRFAKCREAAKRASLKANKGVEVPPLQRLLLGPHASLPRLAQCDTSPGLGDTIGTMGSDEMPKRKKRQHRVWTSAAGFVKYEG